MIEVIANAYIVDANAANDVVDVARSYCLLSLARAAR